MATGSRTKKSSAAKPLLKLRVEALTPELWPALEDLFGGHGACNRCWCMYWRVGAEYRKRPRELNKMDLQRIVQHGTPPGLLALEGDVPVGWCQLTPRDALPWFDHVRSVRRVDEVPVWSISCFYVRIGYRRRGITAALIQAAIEAARKAGAPAVEAYPLDGNVSPSATGTGYASTFARLGFIEIARHSPQRPIMRYEL